MLAQPDGYFRWPGLLERQAANGIDDLDAAFAVAVTTRSRVIRMTCLASDRNFAVPSPVTSFMAMSLRYEGKPSYLTDK